MTIELVILLTLTAFIYGPITMGEGGLIGKTFKSAGPHLGGRIERQLDTAAGFQEIATGNIDNPLSWSDR